LDFRGKRKGRKKGQKEERGKEEEDGGSLIGLLEGQGGELP